MNPASIRLPALVAGFVYDHRLGIVAGAYATARVAPRTVRIPDLAYYAWEHFPTRKLPTTRYTECAPDLAVEFRDPFRVAEEFHRRIDESFRVGVRLVWYVDPEKLTVEVFTGVDRSTVLHPSDTLDGGDVLPGFTLPLARLFGELTPQA